MDIVVTGPSPSTAASSDVARLVLSDLLGAAVDVAFTDQRPVPVAAIAVGPAARLTVQADDGFTGSFADVDPAWLVALLERAGAGAGSFRLSGARGSGVLSVTE